MDVQTNVLHVGILTYDSNLRCMYEQAAKNDFFRIIFIKTLFREDLRMLYPTFNQRFFSKRAPAGIFLLCRDKIRFIQDCGVVVFWVESDS